VPGGGGLKRPRDRLGCSIVEESEEAEKKEKTTNHHKQATI
jgi:hypothetical protein